jgi:hypothetical protein
MSMKNSAMTFHGLDTLESTMWPTYPTGFKNTSLAYRVLTRILWNPYWAHLSMKNIVLMVQGLDTPACTMWPVDPIGWKKWVWHNVCRHFFYGNRTGSSRAWKIVCRHCAPRMHQHAHIGPQIPMDAKTKVRRNISRRAIYGNRTRRTWAWK